MKKTKLKNYLKLGLLLFGIAFVLTNCNDEIINEKVENNSRLKKLTFTSFKKIKEKPQVKKSTKKLLVRDFSKSNDNSFIVDTTSVQTIATDYYTNYTFLAEFNNEDDETYLCNYVLTIYDNDTYHQMLVKYPIIDYGDEIDYDMENIIVEPLGGDMIVKKTFGDCMGYVTYDPQKQTVIHDCGLSGHHQPGQACSDGVYRAYKEVITVLVATCHPVFEYISAGEDGNTYGGGGGNITIPDRQTTDPIVLVPYSKKRECIKIKNIVNLNTVFKQQLNTLATTAPNIDHEISITYSTATPPTMNILEGTQGSGGTAINPNPSDPYATVAHIHDNYGLDGSGTYSVPSFADLKLLAKILYNNKLLPNKFTAFLSTAKGTHFAITINDANKFKDLFYSKNILFGDIDPNNSSLNQKWRNSNILLGSLDWKYYKKDNPNCLIKETASASENETQLQHFLSFLNQGDAGVSIFETDENFEDFTEVTLNPFDLNGSLPIIRKQC